MKQREPIWWIPLARRVLSWGLTMFVLWSALALLFTVLPFSYQVMLVLEGDAFDDERIGKAIGSSLLLLGGCFICAGGLITGVLTGFYAPPSEPKNPLRSQFFVNVGKSAFVFWLVSSSILTVNICGFLLYFDFKFPDDYALALLIGLIALFGIGLWRALDHALRVG